MAVAHITKSILSPFDVDDEELLSGEGERVIPECWFCVKES